MVVRSKEGLEWDITIGLNELIVDCRRLLPHLERFFVVEACDEFTTASILELATLFLGGVFSDRQALTCPKIVVELRRQEDARYLELLHHGIVSELHLGVLRFLIYYFLDIYVECVGDTFSLVRMLTVCSAPRAIMERRHNRTGTISQLVNSLESSVSACFALLVDGTFSLAALHESEEEIYNSLQQRCLPGIQLRDVLTRARNYIAAYALCGNTRGLVNDREVIPDTQQQCTVTTPPIDAVDRSLANVDFLVGNNLVLAQATNDIARVSKLLTRIMALYTPVSQANSVRTTAPVYSTAQDLIDGVDRWPLSILFNPGGLATASIVEDFSQRCAFVTTPFSQQIFRRDPDPNTLNVIFFRMCHFSSMYTLAEQMRIALTDGDSGLPIWKRGASPHTIPRVVIELDELFQSQTRVIIQGVLDTVLRTLAPELRKSAFQCRVQSQSPTPMDGRTRLAEAMAHQLDWWNTNDPHVTRKPGDLMRRFLITHEKSSPIRFVPVQSLHVAHNAQPFFFTNICAPLEAIRARGSFVHSALATNLETISALRTEHAWADALYILTQCTSGPVYIITEKPIQDVIALFAGLVAK